ncbi:MAG: hypothetical protein Q7J16_02145 [Candidatus Cloacimonadales bacterium]|nr:hypothetical protein [Candidatus Cloacimonadales bacterium]
MNKIIRLKYEIFSNYNAHLLSVAKIGFDSDYSKTYFDSIDSIDLKFLQENKNLLKWGDGQMSKLTELIIFFPNYINLKNINEIETYFNLLNKSIEMHSFNNFKNKYQSYISNLKDWFKPNFDSHLYSFNNEIKRISEIYIKNFDNFLNDVWPIEKEKIREKINTLSNRLSEFNFIKLWEDVTKLNFKYAYYDIVLSTGIKNGPSANSLGYEKNWFYYNSDTEWFIQFICHETGTHILIDLFKNKMLNNESDISSNDFNIIYKAYENLCSFYNRFVLREAGLEHNYKMRNYDENSFFEIYNLLFSVNKNISAQDLFNTGINEYKRKTVV